MKITSKLLKQMIKEELRVCSLLIKHGIDPKILREIEQDPMAMMQTHAGREADDDAQAERKEQAAPVEEMNTHLDALSRSDELNAFITKNGKSLTRQYNDKAEPENRRPGAFPRGFTDLLWLFHKLGRQSVTGKGSNIPPPISQKKIAEEWGTEEVGKAMEPVGTGLEGGELEAIAAAAKALGNYFHAPTGIARLFYPPIKDETGYASINPKAKEMEAGLSNKWRIFRKMLETLKRQGAFG